MYYYEVHNNNLPVATCVCKTVFWRKAARIAMQEIEKTKEDDYIFIHINEYTWLSAILGIKRSVRYRRDGKVYKMLYRSIFWSKIKNQFI